MWFDFIRWHVRKGRPFYSNDVIWLHQVTIPLNQGTVPLFELHQIQPEWCDTELHFTRNSQLIHVHRMRDRNPKSVTYTGAFPRRSWGVKIYLLVFAPICFLWNNLWSVSCYIMRPFSGWWRLVGRTSPVSNPPIWKCRSGIGDHRFPFFMDMLPNYTFYTNLTSLFIGYLFTEDVTSMITFNLWKVEKIMRPRLMLV